MDLTTALRECKTEKAYEDTCQRIDKTHRINLRGPDILCSELRDQRGRYLRNSDIDAFFSDKMHYGYYWKPPSGVNLDASHILLSEAERGTTEDAVGVWKRQLVRTLFRKLKSREVASVVLSCVHPKDFGVFSPPTLSLLQIALKPPVDHYLAYCEELAAWGAHFLGTEAVQVADRALWVFYQAAYGQDKTRQAGDYQRAFESDEWVRQRHASNLLKPYLRNLTVLQQANLLLNIDGNLAAKIAGCEFEVRVKELIDECKPIRDKKIGEFRATLPPKPNRHEWGDFESMIEYVLSHNAERYGAYRQQFQRVRDLRNAAIHDDRLLTPKEIEFMIAMAAKLPERQKLRRLT